MTGTFFAQREEFTWESFVLAVPVGLLATAILMVNNIRDLETDRRAGKKTLAVRLGRARARIGYALLIYVAFAHRAAGLGARRRAPDRRGCCCRGWRCRSRRRSCAIVRNRVDGPSLNGALARTGMLQLVFCLLLSAGLLLSR